MRKSGLLVLLSLLLFCSSLLADQVTLKNGDRLTGSIVKSDDKSLVLKTDYAGQLTIEWTAVQAINSTQPLNLALKNGQTVAGPVTTTDGKLQVTTRAGRRVEAAPQDVAAIRNNAEQAAYEQSLNPGFSQNWAGGLNLGYALTRGNSRTSNLALAFNANRATLHDKLSFYANSVYATNSSPGTVSSTTANAEQGGARYDHDLTDRIFAFLNADFQADALLGLNLRSVLGGGLGVHLIKRPNTTLDLLPGINYTRESFVTLSRNFMAATLGEELTHKLNARTSFTESFFFYPNLTSTGDYRANFTAGFVTKLNNRLGWQIGVGDIYLTNPPPGKLGNDLLLTTGLNISFAD